MIDYFIEDIPSRRTELLRKFIGSTVKAIVRCSWDTFNDFDKDRLYNIVETDFFRLTAGAIVFILDNNYEIAFSSQENKSSIIVWVEKDDKGREIEGYYAKDEEFFLIDSKNEKYTTKREQNINNQIITSVKILKIPPQSVKYDGLPNEVGLQFEFNNGEALVMAHNLIPSSDSFAVAYRNEISQEILNEVTEIEI